MMTCCVTEGERREILSSRVDRATTVIERTAHKLGWAEMFCIAQDLSLEYGVEFSGEAKNMTVNLEGLQLVAFAAACAARAEALDAA